MQQMLRQRTLPSILVILCLAVAFAKDAASPATLQQLELIEKSIATSLTTCNDDYKNCDVSTSPNITVNQCDDFYTYACGQWDGEKSSRKTQRKNYLESLKLFLLPSYHGIDELSTHNQSLTDKVLAFYKSCGAGKSFDLFEALKPSSDVEWPLIDKFNGKPETNVDNFDLVTFLGQLFGLGFDDIILSHSVRRESNGSLYIELFVPAEIELVESVSTEMHHSFKEFGKEKCFEILPEYNDEIRETHFKWGFKEQLDFPNDERELFTYEEIKELYPKVAKLLKAMLPNQIADDDLISLGNTEYLDYFTTKRWQPEEIRQVLNYIMARIVAEVKPTTYRNCEDMINTQMPFAVSYLYRKHFYTAEVQKVFNDLKEKIVKSLLAMVDENRLEFTAEQVQAIKQRISKTYVSIGNIPVGADDAIMAEFYRHMPDMDMDNYGKNFLLSMHQRFWESFNCPPNMECTDGINYEMYSMPDLNLIVIPMADMRPILFDSTYDPILLVSLMGSDLGSEYGYIMDTDALTDSNIYSDDIYSSFKNHPNLQAAKECTENQFDTTYERQLGDDLIDFMHANAHQLEDDLIAARAAFQVYNNEYKIQPTFTERPWQQLFFLNYAQRLCEQRNWIENPTKANIKTNYVVMNMEEFAKAFECPEGSKMNPADKCYVY